MSVRHLIRKRFFPHLWCPGCGHGIILNGLLRAVNELGLDQCSLCMVSGIGCSSRISGYVDFHSMHTLHGRALAFATGLKLTRPGLNVFVPMGDGDATAIGGNHFIHACRRNIDRAFNTVDLAIGAGATFVARTTAFHVKEISQLIKKAYQHKGFSVVEVLSQCPTYFGRKNKLGGAVEMLQWYRDNTAPLGSKKLEENPQLIPRGVFVDKDAPEYCDEYANIIKRANKE